MLRWDSHFKAWNTAFTHCALCKVDACAYANTWKFMYLAENYVYGWKNTIDLPRFVQGTDCRKLLAKKNEVQPTVKLYLHSTGEQKGLVAAGLY